MIKLTAKKVYCPRCQELVGIKQQKSGEKDQFSCIKCNNIIWNKESLKWKYNKREE